MKIDYFEVPERYPGKFLALLSSEVSLESCVKSGVWERGSRFGNSNIKWSSQNHQYFKDTSISDNSKTVIGNFLHKVTLYEIHDVRCTPLAKQQNSLNKYSMRITKGVLRNGPRLDSVFYAVALGGDSFQHFVQDVSPILAFYRDFLNESPSTELVIQKPLISFRSFEMIFARLNIINPVRFIESNDYFSANKLFLPMFSPFNALYSTPVKMYESLSNIIMRTPRKISKKGLHLLWVLRKEKFRNIENQDALISQLKAISNMHNFIFDVVNTSVHTPQSIAEKFELADIVLGIHGGANYNIIFSQPGTTLIEFIPNMNTNTLADFCLSLGMNYLAVPLAGSTANHSFTVPLHEILAAIEIAIQGAD